MNFGLTLRHYFSYALRSPINPELLKTAEGRAQLQKRIEQRFKPESLLPATVDQYESFRKGKDSPKKSSTISKNSANSATKSNSK